MANLKKSMSLLCGPVIASCAMIAAAQSANQSGNSNSASVRHVCGTAKGIPLTGSEPPAKIFIDPPLPGPLAPVFGANAVAVSPRVEHIHVSVDDASWVWADASGNPIILQGLSPGPHKVRVDLVDANHHPLDKGVITFVVPEKSTSESISDAVHR